VELFCSAVGYGNACALINDPVVLPADWLVPTIRMADLAATYLTMEKVAIPNCT
jgi:hypothetical protein